MDSRVLTHLSVEDINVYLLGKPATDVSTAIEEHCLDCPECLEQICALAARIDKSQLAQQPVPAAIAPVPQRYTPIVQSQPAPMWQGWAINAAAAGLLLLIIPNPARFVHIDNLVHSPLSIAAMDLPFTRAFSTNFDLLTRPAVEIVKAPGKKPRTIQPIAYKQFQFPEAEKPMELVQVALIDAPNFHFGSDSIDPIPVELDVAPAAVYRSKPNIFKRLLSAVIAPFRAPRS
jgi:hypothetical protein